MAFRKGENQLTNTQPYWVVVADASRAVIYSREKRRDPLVQSLILENQESRKKAGELLADRGGRSFDSHGQGRHTLGKEETGPKREVTLAFARELTRIVDKAKQSGECREFGLIAAPEFLGMLRNAMSRSVNLVPSFEIDKNVVDYDAEEISDLIDRVLSNS